MEERAASNLHAILFAYAHCLRQFEGQVCHSLSVSLGLFIAQIKRVGPAFERGLVGETKFDVRALEVFEERGAIEGKRSLPGERFEEIHPFRVGDQWRAIERLQHAFDLPFRDQRHAVIAYEAFDLK